MEFHCRVMGVNISCTASPESAVNLEIDGGD